MGTLLILLLSILAAVLLGLIFGLIIGKSIVKRRNSNHQALLSTGERVAYIASVFFGAILIFLGLLFKMPEAGANMPPSDVVITDNAGFAEEGFSDKNAVTDDAEAAQADTAVTDNAETDSSGEVGGEDGIAVANAVALA